MMKDMISKEQAIRIFTEKFYETFNMYPPESYTYEISIYNGDWLITYDDNDGIGGLAVLLIDGVTGEAGEVKVEE